MKLVELTIEDLEIEGVFGLSLVSEPANDTEFMLFSKEMFQFSKIDTEKRIITGLVMQPNKKIKKHIKGEVVDVFFSKETIEKMSQNYLRDFFQFSTSVDHEKDVDGVYLVEQWLVSDIKNDKAVALGFSDVSVGDWYVSLKVENDEVLENIKKGKYNGFSLEGLFNQKIIKMSEEEIVVEEKVVNNEPDVMDNNTLFDNIKGLFKKKDDKMSEEKKDVIVEEKTIVEDIKEPVVEDIKEPVIEDIKEPVIEEKKEPIVEEKKEPVVDEKMQKILDRLENLEKENEDLKVEAEKKEQLKPKMGKDVTDIPQTFAGRMSARLERTRKGLGQ